MKFIISISLLCLGSWGLLSGLFFPDYSTEIFLGMIAPLLVGTITVPIMKKTHITDPNNLTRFMMKGFLAKMILYGAYVSVIIGFYTFNAIPFVLSFVGYFVMLHVLEALFLRSIFKKS